MLCTFVSRNNLCGHQLYFMFMIAFDGKNISEQNEVTVNADFIIAIPAGFLNNVVMVALAAAHQRGQYFDSGFGVFPAKGRGNIVRRARHKQTVAARAMQLSQTGKEKPEVVINFGNSRNG